MDKGLLRAIFAGGLQADEWIELRVLTKVGSDGKRQRVAQPKNFFKNSETLLQAAQDIGQEYMCAFGVNPRRDKGMRKEAVTRALALWVDIDNKDFDSVLAAEQATHSFILPTSYVVHTGYGYHTYWLLEGDCPIPVAEEVGKALLTAVGGDPGTWNVDTILRVPGTWNLKKEEPVLAQVIRARPDLRYTVQDLLAATKVRKDIKRKVLLATVDKGKSRSERDWAVIRALKGHGMSDDTIRVIYREQAVGDKARERDGEGYLARTLAKVDQRTVAAVQYFTEEKGYYFVEGLGGKSRHQVSTFIFKPLRLMQEVNEDVLWGDIHAGGQVWEGVTLPKSAFASVRTLLKHLGRVDWHWLGSDREVRFLLPYLVDQWALGGQKTARATTVLGRHGNLWVTAQGTYTETECLPLNEAPLVYVDPRRTTPGLHYVTPPEEGLKEFYTALYRLLPRINEAGVVWPILGWFMATPVKPVLAESQIRFPHLELYGTKGSGKSSTILGAFLPLLGYTTPHSWDCSTTPFVLLSLAASTNAIPVSLSEFRRETLSDREFTTLRRILLLSYDVGKDSRGRADQTTQEYTLSAPLVLDGEDVIADPAIQERTIIVNLSPQTVAIGTDAWEAYLELGGLPLHKFAVPYIQYTLGFTAAKLAKLWKRQLTTIEETFPDIVADRVRRNLVTTLCGVRLFESFLSSRGVDVTPIDAQVLSPSLREVEKSELGRGETMADTFVQELINAVVLSPAGKPFLWIYEPGENVLWVQLSTALSWWYKERRRKGLGALQAAAVKVQLRERSMEREGKGQYIHEPKAYQVRGVRRRLYGVDIGACYEAGLDVPSALELTSIVVPLTRAVTTLKEENKDDR